jgi:hypothetical protein
LAAKPNPTCVTGVTLKPLCKRNIQQACQICGKGIADSFYNKSLHTLTFEGTLLTNIASAVNEAR